MKQFSQSKSFYMIAAGFTLTILLHTKAGADEKIIFSNVHNIVKKYKSMQGPVDHRDVYITDQKDQGDPELLWVTGYNAVMVEEDGATPALQEFMCHSNLDFDASYHIKKFGWHRSVNGRLFTLSQGQFDVDFPEGFGIPVISNRPFNLFAQVLNLNYDNQTFRVRHKVTIKYEKERDLKKALKPLFPTGVYGLAALQEDGRHYGVADPDEETHGPGCLLAPNATTHIYTDANGNKFTGHWVVKPGKEVNRTLVTNQLNLPYDTTIHYIAVHLHPFAESLELRDLTTGETVFKSYTRNFADKIGLEHVDHYSSPEGLSVYKSHDYEIVSVYNNTTDENQDSMAVMYLYILSKDFTKPSLGPPTVELPPHLRKGT